MSESELINDRNLYSEISSSDEWVEISAVGFDYLEFLRIRDSKTVKFPISFRFGNPYDDFRNDF